MIYCDSKYMLEYKPSLVSYGSKENNLKRKALYTD